MDVKDIINEITVRIDRLRADAVEDMEEWDKMDVEYKKQNVRQHLREDAYLLGRLDALYDLLYDIGRDNIPTRDKDGGARMNVTIPASGCITSWDREVFTLEFDVESDADRSALLDALSDRKHVKVTIEVME